MTCLVLLVCAAGPPVVDLAALGAEVRLIHKGKPLAGLHESYIVVLAFSPDGRFAATGTFAGGVSLWDTRTGRLAWNQVGHSSSVYSLAFSSNGRMLASGGGPSTFKGPANVRLWVCDTGRAEGDWVAGAGAINSVAFLDGGKVVVTHSEFGDFRWWDTATGRRLGEADIGYSANLLGAAKGREARYWQDDGGVFRLRLDARKPVVRLIEGHSRSKTLCAVPLRGGMMLMYTNGQSRWLDAQGQAIHSAGPHGPVNRRTVIAYSPDGALLAIRSKCECRAEIRQTATGRLVRTLGDGSLGLTEIAFSPDGRRLAACWTDASATIHDVSAALVPAALEAWMAAGASLPTVLARRDAALLLLSSRLWWTAESERLAARLLARLDDDSFKVREDAHTRLAALGPLVALALKRAVALPPSPEVGGRARRLLAALDPKDLRLLGEPAHPRRTAELLRLLGTPAALSQLKCLAALPDSVPHGVEARRVLGK